MILCFADEPELHAPCNRLQQRDRLHSKLDLGRLCLRHAPELHDVERSMPCLCIPLGRLHNPAMVLPGLRPPNAQLGDTLGHWLAGRSDRGSHDLHSHDWPTPRLLGSTPVAD